VNLPDHCIHTDPHLGAARAMEYEIARTHPTDGRWRLIGPAMDGEWIHEIEGTRLRISTSMAGTCLNVGRIAGLSTEASIEFPWNRDVPIPHPGLVVAAMVAALEAARHRGDESVVTAWAVGACAILDEEQKALGTGRRVRMVTLPGPKDSGQAFRALLDDMRLVESPVATAIGAIAPTTLMVMGSSNMLWIQPASFSTDPGDEHDPAADPVGTLRASAMIRAALNAARGIA
jgi:hypothetical protein